MSLVNTIQKAVDAAFKAAGDKVLVGTLGGETVSGFNFSTGTLTSALDPRDIELIEFQTEFIKDEHVKKQVVVKSVNFNLSVYSTLFYNSQVHYIEDIEAYDGATLLTLRGV